MQLTKIITIISILFLLASCEKDDSLSLYEDMGDEPLLKEVLIDDELYYEYSYNKAGLVVEEKSKYSFSKHAYNSKNQLLRSDHYLDDRVFSSSSYVLDELAKRTEWVSPTNTELYSFNEFDYDKNGNLKRHDTNRLATDYKSYSEYSYNEDGYIENRTFYDSENRASGFDNYFYDIDGNVIRKERYHITESGGEELQTTNEYEFDSHRNPYLSFRGLMTPGKYTNTNNIVKDTYRIYFEVPGFDNDVQVTLNEFSYNENGYPERKNGIWEYVYY